MWIVECRYYYIELLISNPGLVTDDWIPRISRKMDLRQFKAISWTRLFLAFCQIFGNFDYFFKDLQRLRSSSLWKKNIIKWAKNLGKMKKSLVQLALNPFFHGTSKPPGPAGFGYPINGYYCNFWRINVYDMIYLWNHLRSYRILEPIWSSVGWERVMNFFVKDELWLPQMSIYFFKPWTLIISYRQETQQTYNEVNFCAKLIPSFKIRNCNNLLSNFYRSQFRS